MSNISSPGFSDEVMTNGYGMQSRIILDYRSNTAPGGHATTVAVVENTSNAAQSLPEVSLRTTYPTRSSSELADDSRHAEKKKWLTICYSQPSSMSITLQQQAPEEKLWKSPSHAAPETLQYDMQLLVAANYDTPYPQIPGSENHTGPDSTDEATFEALVAWDQDWEPLPEVDQHPQVNVTPAVKTVQVTLPAPFTPEAANTVTEQLTLPAASSPEAGNTITQPLTLPGAPTPKAVNTVTPQLTLPAVSTPNAARRKTNPPAVMASAQNGLEKSKARPERKDKPTPPPRQPKKTMNLTLDLLRQQPERAPRQPRASRKTKAKTMPSRQPKKTMNLSLDNLCQVSKKEELADLAEQERDIAFRLRHACADPVNAQPMYQHGAFDPSQSESPLGMNFCKSRYRIPCSLCH